MTLTERLLTILRCLGIAQRHGQRSMTSDAIHERMAGVYDGETGERKWRRDIRILRERGLVETDLPPNRTGISLRVPPKPGNLHLTAAEHRAITTARRVLRPGLPAVSPVGSDGRPRDIDLVTSILRFLEENGDDVEFAELADYLSIPESAAFELVDVLTHEGVFDRGLVASLVMRYPDCDDDADDAVPLSVSVLRGRSESPTRFCGMDELGFFPYSLEETDERLALIDDALTPDGTVAGIPARHDKHLRSAGRKLSEWKRELHATS